MHSPDIITRIPRLSYLKGAWLEALGFEPGTSINVECDGGRIVITRTDEVIME